MSSPKRDVCDLAARFALKARSDEITLEKLVDDHDVPDDVIGFHAQQAVEKLLKAALANAGVPPPRVHDPGRLVALLDEGRERDGGTGPRLARSAARPAKHLSTAR